MIGDVRARSNGQTFSQAQKQQLLKQLNFFPFNWKLPTDAADQSRKLWQEKQNLENAV